MATETFFLPGYGIVVDAEDGDEVFIPGYGVVVNNPAAGDSGYEAADFLRQHYVRWRRRGNK